MSKDKIQKRFEKIKEFAKTDGPDNEKIFFKGPLYFVTRSEAKIMAKFNDHPKYVGYMSIHPPEKRKPITGERSKP